MKRRRMFQAFKVAAEAGNYAEMPMLPAQVDPQVYLSNNTVAQPFFLICSKDTVIAQLSGEAVVHLKDSSVNYFNLESGDNVYVPAGTPHQIVPLTPSVHIRYKPQEPGLEGVAWFCSECGKELCRAEWDTEVIAPQRAYYDACVAFNEQAAVRTCDGCGDVHASVAMDQFASWLEIAAGLEAERTEALAKAAASS